MIAAFAKRSEMFTLIAPGSIGGVAVARALDVEEFALLARCESTGVDAFTAFAKEAAPVDELVGVRLADGSRTLLQFSESYAGETLLGVAMVSWIRLESVAVEMGAGMVLEEISRQPRTGLETPAPVTEEATHEQPAQG